MDLAEILEDGQKFQHTDNKTDEHNTPIPYVLFISISTLFGTVGNLLIIGTVLSYKKLRTVCNIFIVNLAIADLCVTGIVNPFSLIGVFVGDKWFSERLVLCEAVASLCLTSCYCSMQSIGAISFNRYIHICHNKLYSIVFTPVKTTLMVIALWIVSFLMEMPSFFGWGDHVYDEKTRSCIWDRTADFSYTLFFSTAGVVFPVTLISVSYLKIYLYVRKSKQQVSHYNSADQTDNRPSENKDLRVSTRLTLTLFIIFVVFVSCWSPYAIAVTADINNTFPENVHLYVLLLAHMNSSLNWLVYGATNREFRRGYIKFLRLHELPCMQRFLFSKGEVRPTNVITKPGTHQLGVSAVQTSETHCTKELTRQSAAVGLSKKSLIPRVDHGGQSLH